MYAYMSTCVWTQSVYDTLIQIHSFRQQKEKNKSIHLVIPAFTFSTLIK